MTISATSPLISYAGNGTSTAFAVTFQFLLPGDLVVSIKNNSTGVVTTKALTTHYTVTGGNGSTGTVTMLTAPASGETLVIYSSVVFDQQTDYVENDKFPAQSHERALDKLTMLAKQLLVDIGRSMRIPTASSVGINTELPPPIGNHVLAWNSSGTGLAAIDPATFATIGAAGSFTVDQFSGTGAQTAFTLSRAPGLENNTYVYVSGVYISKLAYSISGSTITFNTAPEVGTNNIEVCQSVALEAGTPADGTVSVASLSPGFGLPYTQIANSSLQTLGGMPSARATDVAGLSAYVGGLLNDADAATARATLGAQETLSSGVNIKTVGGTSLLGSGNIPIGAMGQTWSNASRASGTSFQNTTNTVQVFSMSVSGASSLMIEVSPDNSTFYKVFQASNVFGNAAVVGGIAVIPPGHYCRPTYTGTVVFQTELS